MVEGGDTTDKDKKDSAELPNFEFPGTSHAPIEEHDSQSGEEVDETGQRHEEDELKTAIPLQKRRRVTRACDECRRKKIKCDGKQPCTHCTVYSYECTYNQPSNRRRNPTPQYIEALETRLQRAEALLKTFLPNVNLADPDLIARLPPDLGPPKPPPDLNKYGHAQGKGADAKTQTEAERDSLLESMVKGTGSLDLDGEGHWDFHGHSSGMVFLQRLRQQFGDMFGATESAATMLARPRYNSSATPRIYDSPDVDSPFESVGSHGVELPSREVAYQLCDLTMSDACSLMRFMHKPTFWAAFHRIYDKMPEEWGTEEHRYLPLLYSLLAVGSMFAKDEDSRLHKEGYTSSLDKGYKWFSAARRLLDVTDCRDIPSLQAIICMIMFLQSTAVLSTCFCYVGIALHSAIRMGLHRSISGKFNYVELESRRRLFWQIRKMDVYVGAMLGFPTMLSEDDFDQDYPLDIDDEFITPTEILPSPSGHIHLITGSNAQIKLLLIMRKVIKYVYPIKGVQSIEGKPGSYVVSHAKIREIEKELQHWMEQLPMFLRPGGEVSPELARVQQLLRMAYAYVQMFTYRPFLHYVSKSKQQTNIDKRSYACAAACVSVSRNVIHITQEMRKRGLLIGSFWFTMYTTFLAIMALVFFALENPDSKSSEDIMKDARIGKEILSQLAKGSMAADRCSATLEVFFERLPERLRHSQIINVSTSKRKSFASTPVPSIITNKNSNPDLKPSTPEPSIRRASTFPRQEQATANYRNPSMTTSSYSGYTQDKFSSPETAQTNNFVQYNFSNPSSSLGVSEYNIPELSAMMFPSGDPFAYPNQPMTTLENNARFATTSPRNSNLSTAAGNTAMSSPQPALYGTLPHGGITNSAGLEAQLSDPLQPYLSMDYNQAPGAGVFGAEMGSGLDDEMAGIIKEEGFPDSTQQWWGHLSSTSGGGGGAGGETATGSGGWGI